MAIIFASATVYGQDAKLIEGAKKEGGKAVVYGSLESGTTDAIIEAYWRRTGLDVD
jgi:hypothetical protein